MLRFAFKISLTLMFLGLVSGACLLLYFLPKLPDVEELRDVKMQIPLRVYTSNGSLISEYGEKRRIPVSIDNVPQHLTEAFIASEDARFYDHPGVDWQGILRAAINVISTGGDRSQGGSTITMQVARNFFLTFERTYERKIIEIFLSLKIERELSKNEILELYVNKIFFGQRAYGVGAAAQVYYGKTVNELNLSQLAMIAGLPKAPSTTNPITNPEKAKIRRNYVLGRMLELEYIDRISHDEAVKAPVTAKLYRPVIELEASYVAEMVRSQLITEYGDDVYNDGYKVYTTISDKLQNASNVAIANALMAYDIRHGYRGRENYVDLEEQSDESSWEKILAAYSSIGKLQAALIISVDDELNNATAYLSDTGIISIPWEGLQWARKLISENYRGPSPKSTSDVLGIGDIVRVIQNDDGSWRLSQVPEVEGGLVSMDPNNGATLALVGGFDFYRSKFNRITQAKRQPGSSFKPFIYSAALEKGFTAASMINDAPIVFDDPSIEDTWRPQNSSKKSGGPTRLRLAITKSLNLVSIRLLNEVGIPYALDYVTRFGFDKADLPHGLSLALGTGAITPWQSASAYTALANGGYKVEPYFIERIEDAKGNIIFQAEPVIVCKNCTHEDNGLEAHSNRIAERIADEENIWIVNSLTRDVVRYGTGIQAWRELKRSDLSGKTGTTNDQRDAWFAGYNSSIVTVSWVGFDDSRQLGNGEYGGKAALPMWIDYMRVALEDIPDLPIKNLPGLVSIRIDPETGQPTHANTPGAFFEVFRLKHAPKQTGNSGVPLITGNKGEDNSPETIF
jgi:penicillin-binding protein 1A